MKRRNFLKGVTLLAAGGALSGPVAGAAGIIPSPFDAAPASGQDGIEPLKGLSPVRSLTPEVSRPISVIIIGCGNRGRTYAGYARKFPAGMKVVGVSDILEHRARYLGDQHNVPAEMRFGHFREVFAGGKKLADAVVIATPDDRHYEPCMEALELGYDVLLEKPVAPTKKECENIRAMVKKTGRIVALCHVLRYAPYFMALREVVKSGAIGDVVNIQHQEPIQYAHMAHSYVRGNWRREDETTPIILAKSCHDLDILRWIIDKPCKYIDAAGSLSFFKAENAPEGAPRYCTDGCPHQKECPYDAVDIYTRQKKHIGVFDLEGSRDAALILSRLKDPRYKSYARCVFHCDNDQPDHYVAIMGFEDGVTASFSMDAFAPSGGRRTKIMGTLGYIEGDGKSFTVTDFLTRTPKLWNHEVAEIGEYANSGHGGGDLRLVRDWLEAIDRRDPDHLSSSIDVAFESHMMGFAAERSRRSGKKEKIK